MTKCAVPRRCFFSLHAPSSEEDLCRRRDSQMSVWHGAERWVRARGCPPKPHRFDLKWRLSQTRLWVRQARAGLTMPALIHAIIPVNTSMLVYRKTGLERAQYSHPPPLRIDGVVTLIGHHCKREPQWIERLCHLFLSKLGSWTESRFTGYEPGSVFVRDSPPRRVHSKCFD